MHQYMSGFCDNEKIYPVKLTVEERIEEKKTHVHVVITVGKIEREALPNARVQPFNGESARAGVTPLKVSLADFVKFFNREHGVLLKNIPDGFLSEKQKGLKERVRVTDAGREQKCVETRVEIGRLAGELRRLKYEPIEEYEGVDNEDESRDEEDMGLD